MNFFQIGDSRIFELRSAHAPCTLRPVFQSTRDLPYLSRPLVCVLCVIIIVVCRCTSVCHIQVWVYFICMRVMYSFNCLCVVCEVSCGL